MNTRIQDVPRRQARAFLESGTATDMALIAIVWLAGSLIVNPVGEFPLNDDWSYSRAVMNLIETGDYRPLGWAVMSLFTHVLWGALFTLPDGFSFTALRLSSITAGLLGLVGTYVLIRDQGQTRPVALVVTFCLAFFPAYYVLSHTFMTDISFTAMAIWSTMLLARAIRNGSNLYLMSGTAFAAMAILSRQLGLAIPIAFAVTMLLTRPLNIHAIIRSLIPLAICIAALLTYNEWLALTDRAPVQYIELSADPLKHTKSIGSLITHLSIFGFYTPIYIGLFLLPVFMLMIQHPLERQELRRIYGMHRRSSTGVLVGVTVAFAWSAYHLASKGFEPMLPMFDRGNQLGQFGLGPMTLRDSIVLRLDHHVVAIPTTFWIIITALGVFGAILLTAKLSLHAIDLSSPASKEERRFNSRQLVCIFLVLCGCVYMFPLVLWGFYDRYLILLLPWLAGAMLGIRNPADLFAPTNRQAVISISLIVFWSVISIGGTRDYLNWNRVRWQAINDLMQGYAVDARDIDGGFEFNGLHLYDPAYKADPNSPSSRSSWWVERDTYQIGFGPVPGYTVIKEYSYHHLIPPHDQKIVVMKKKSASSSDD